MLFQTGWRHLANCRAGATQNKKADVAEHPEAFQQVGLLINQPTGKARLLFTSSSREIDQILCQAAIPRW
jgi:hypothetical protein